MDMETLSELGPSGLQLLMMMMQGNTAPSRQSGTRAYSTGLGLDIGAIPPPHFRGTEFVRSIPVSNTGEVSRVLGLLGGALQFLGVPGFKGATSVPPYSRALGTAGSVYGATVSAEAQSQISKELMSHYAQAFGYDFAKISDTLGLSSLLGTTGDHVGGVIAALSDTGLGRWGLQYLTSMPMVQEALGGNLLAPISGAFGGRAFLGLESGALFDAYDPDTLIQATGVAGDVAKRLTQLMRRNTEGAPSLLRNLKFTRGFKDEDITDMFMAMVRSGGMEDELDIVRKNFDIRRSDMESFQPGSDADIKSMTAYMDRLSRFDDAIEARLAPVTKTLEALGDVLGTRDFNKLRTVLDRMTQGGWTTADATDFERLGNALRNIEALGVITNVDKGVIVKSIDNAITAAQSAVGITPAHLDVGIQGGGLASGEVALRVAENAIRTIYANNIRDPRLQNRVMEQERFILERGTSSKAGRVLAVLESMQEQHSDKFEGGEYQTLYALATSGNEADRLRAEEAILTKAFGSRSIGLQAIASDVFMQQLHDNMSVDASVRLYEGIRTGYRSETDIRLKDEQRRLQRNLAQELERTAGFDTSIPVELRAETRMAAIEEVLSSKGYESDATALRERYDMLVAEKGGASAISDINRQLSATNYLKQYIKDIDKNVDARNLERSRVRLKGGGRTAAGVTAALNTVVAAMPEYADTVSEIRSMLKTGDAGNINDARERVINLLAEIGDTDRSTAQRAMSSMAYAMSKFETDNLQLYLQAASGLETEYKQSPAMRGLVNWLDLANTDNLDEATGRMVERTKEQTDANINMQRTLIEKGILSAQGEMPWLSLFGLRPHGISKDDQARYDKMLEALSEQTGVALNDIKSGNVGAGDLGALGEAWSTMLADPVNAQTMSRVLAQTTPMEYLRQQLVQQASEGRERGNIIKSITNLMDAAGYVPEAGLTGLGDIDMVTGALLDSNDFVNTIHGTLSDNDYLKLTGATEDERKQFEEYSTQERARLKFDRLRRFTRKEIAAHGNEVDYSNFGSIVRSTDAALSELNKNPDEKPATSSTSDTQAAHSGSGTGVPSKTEMTGTLVLLDPWGVKHPCSLVGFGMPTG